jgi:hypothetical protein
MYLPSQLPLGIPFSTFVQNSPKDFACNLAPEVHFGLIPFILLYNDRKYGVHVHYFCYESVILIPILFDGDYPNCSAAGPGLVSCEEGKLLMYVM